MKSTLPRVRAVAPGKRFSLAIAWNDGTKSRVDLTGLVHTSRRFRVFANDPAAFRRVKPDEFGTGIEWDNGLDYSAATLKILADEQKPMNGTSLVRFEASPRPEHA